MRLLRLILALVLLPALLLPGGFSIGLCLCPALRKAQAPCALSCCPSQRPSRHDELPTLSWTCTGCYSLALPDQKAKQQDPSRALDTSQPTLLFRASWPPVHVVAARMGRVSSSSGARTPLPPGEHRSLPLLI